MTYDVVLAARDSAITPASKKPERNLFGWLFYCMIKARQRQADREIARYLRTNGYEG